MNRSVRVPGRLSLALVGGALGALLWIERRRPLRRAVEEETNSNYSTIFRWWDALHGSLNLGIRQSEVTIGVPAYSLPDDNGVLALNAMPFKRQRDYWKTPDGTHPVRTAHDNKLILE